MNWWYWAASFVFSGKSFFPCVSLAGLTDPQGRACETLTLRGFRGPRPGVAGGHRAGAGAKSVAPHQVTQR